MEEGAVCLRTASFVIAVAISRSFACAVFNCAAYCRSAFGWRAARRHSYCPSVTGLSRVLISSHFSCVCSNMVRVCVYVRAYMGAQTAGVTGWRSVPALDRDHRFGKGRLGAAANGLNTAWQRSARKQLFPPCSLLWLAPVIAGLGQTARRGHARRRHRQRARCDCARPPASEIFRRRT